MCCTCLSAGPTDVPNVVSLLRLEIDSVVKYTADKSTLRRLASLFMFVVVFVGSGSTTQMCSSIGWSLRSLEKS